MPRTVEANNTAAVLRGPTGSPLAPVNCVGEDAGHGPCNHTGRAGSSSAIPAGCSHVRQRSSPQAGRHAPAGACSAALQRPSAPAPSIQPSPALGSAHAPAPPPTPGCWCTPERSCSAWRRGTRGPGAAHPPQPAARRTGASGSVGGQGGWRRVGGAARGAGWGAARRAAAAGVRQQAAAPCAMPFPQQAPPEKQQEWRQPAAHGASLQPHHSVHFIDGLAQRRGLQPRAQHALQQGVQVAALHSPGMGKQGAVGCWGDSMRGVAARAATKSADGTAEQQHRCCVPVEKSPRPRTWLKS